MIMKPNQVLALLGAASLVACGGGSDQVAGIDGGGSPAPVATTVVSVGTISGFGSVIVNGVRYNTSGATITVDGSPGSESDLAVGQVVAVRGTLDTGGTTGVALSIDFDDIVEGTVDSIDLAAETLTVLGQLIRTDADTSFDDSFSPASLAGVNVGDTVEISGFILADGSINATRLSREQPGGELEVTGVVANVTADTFEINGLVVDYSGAMLEDFPNGTIENGQPVEAKGQSLGAAGELIATRVEYEGIEIGDDTIDQVEIEGFVTRFVSASDFDIEGVPVTTNAQTQFENGSSADLALDAKLEVEGSFNASGILVADKIELKPRGNIRIESLVQAVSATELTLLGVTVGVSSSTRFEDKSSANLEPFNLSNVSVGDYVEIRGFLDGMNVVATLLEREDFVGEVSVRGVVDTANDPDFTILGILIQTNGNTEFEGADGLPIDSAAFFSQVPGITVEAEGTLLNSGIVADEVDIEN